jgi:hypothetical protein
MVESGHADNEQPGTSDVCCTRHSFGHIALPDHQLPIMSLWAEIADKLARDQRPFTVVARKATSHDMDNDRFAAKILSNSDAAFGMPVTAGAKIRSDENGGFGHIFSCCDVNLFGHAPQSSILRAEIAVRTGGSLSLNDRVATASARFGIP